MGFEPVPSGLLAQDLYQMTTSADICTCTLALQVEEEMSNKLCLRNRDNSSSQCCMMTHKSHMIEE